MPKIKRHTRHTQLQIENIHYLLSTLKDKKHAPPTPHVYSIPMRKLSYLLSDKTIESHLFKTINKRLLKDLLKENNN